jgi:Zn-dependent peptidase ImmA (M78 family)
MRQLALPLAFRERSERLATDWRRKLGNRRAYDPLPAAELLEALQIRIIEPDDILGLSAEGRQALLNELSAAVISIDPIVVLYNPLHAPTRHESNMMHECAHIILGHPMIPMIPGVSTPPRDPKYEEEAIYLGGCLQIPKRGLLWAIQKGMNAEQIASHFGASIDMVRYRANMTGQSKAIN